MTILPESQHEVLDIAIIGGGAAGLAAARECASKKRMNLNYAVFEKNAEPGGRLETGAYGDDGGAWLHVDESRGETPGNSLYHLFKRLGFSMVKETEQVQVYHDGKRVEEAVFRQIVETAMEKLKAAAQQPEDRPMLSVLDPKTDLEKAIYEAEFGGAESAANLAELSVHDFMSTRSRTSGYLVQGGIGNAMRCYAKTLPPQRMHYNTEITQIEWSPAGNGSATIHTENGKKYFAKQVVITLPLSVLQERIAQTNPPFFIPALPEQKCDAIRNVQMGLMNKVHLPVNSTDFFMQKGIDHNTHLHSYRGTEAKFYLALPQGNPVITCLTGGDAAKTLEAAGKDAATDYAVQGLVDVFGEEVRQHLNLNAAQVTEWGKRHGSYTYATVGNSPARKELGASTGNLHFAGEACHGEWKTQILGAYHSGVDATRAACQRLGIIKSAYTISL